MCRVLGVHRSGYYAWASSTQSPRAVANAQLLAQMKAFYLQSGGVYGSPRIYRDCKAAGLLCSENHVAKLMHQATDFVAANSKASLHSTATISGMHLIMNVTHSGLEFHCIHVDWLVYDTTVIATTLHIQVSASIRHVKPSLLQL